MARAGDLDDDRLRRALFERILADQFGDDMINDARFQQIVDQVASAIAEDDEASALTRTALADLRRAGL